HRLHDGALVESVLMRYPGRVTICISSQAGCGMNCPFCATGQAGLTRNLSTAEIVEQVVAAARFLRHGDLAGGAAGSGSTEEALRVSNVVFMGMGEALANYRKAIDAIHRLVDPSPHGLGMSARGITMSTVGLVPAIDKLAREAIPVTLALSLHAPDDELRDELVPINTRWKVDEALANYRKAIDAIHRLVDPSPHGLGMSARGITMSTVGLVPAIDKLAREAIPVTLALSLHAPDDELRDELVPINTRWKVDEALD